MNRRNFLLSAGVLSALPFATNASIAPANAAKKRSLRIAHMTDIHVVPDGINGIQKYQFNPAKHMAQAFQQIQSMQDAPDFIFNGGDCIMDSLKQTKKDTQAQWNEWQGVLKNELQLPMYSAIGNHDVWGWARNDAFNNHDYGKKWAMEELNLKERYYSFEKGNWKFIVLDSSCFAPSTKKGYTAKLDDTQFFWLKKTLEASNPKTPICILSHIPIISFCPFFDGENEKQGLWQVPGAWMHIDARKIKDLFAKFPQIKTCLSGHIHLQDEVNYLGIKYLCNGAISGGWWNGNYQEFPPAYAIVDLYDDGTVNNQMIPYINS